MGSRPVGDIFFFFGHYYYSANSTLMSLLRFSYFLTPYVAQAPTPAALRFKLFFQPLHIWYYIMVESAYFVKSTPLGLSLGIFSTLCTYVLDILKMCSA